MRPVLILFAALAAEPTRAFAGEALGLDAVMVAARLPAAVPATPGAYVLDRSRIEGRGAVFLPEALAEMPGVSVSQAGGPGGVASIRLRGAASDKALVLVDGAPADDPSAPAGGFDASTLDLAQAERVELLNGPQGSLWGSDAIGGVVSLVTREPDGLALSAEGGSLATRRAAVSIGQAGGSSAFGAAASTYRTRGVSRADVRDGNPEPDGFASTTVQLNLRLQPVPRVTLDGRARWNRADAEYDAGFGGPTGVSDSPDSSEARTASGYLRARISEVLGFDHSLRLDVMDLDRRTDGPFPFRAAGGQQVLRWSAERQGARYGVSFGVDRRSAQADVGDGRRSLGATGAYAILRASPLAGLTVTGSLRRDEPARYQGQTTGRLAVSLQAGGGLVLKGSWGQGFKTPSIFQTTYPCPECSRPGPAADLRPERAEGWDAGASWRAPGGALEVQATYFRLTVADQIAYRLPDGYRNLARASSSGLEAAVAARLPAGFTLRAAYTRDDAFEDPGHARALKVPQDSGSASLGWRGGPARLEGGMRAQSAAPDVYGTIRSFAVGYLSGAYQASRTVAVTVRVENLAAARYQQAFGYGEPERTVFLGLRWRP